MNILNFFWIGLKILCKFTPIYWIWFLVSRIVFIMVFGNLKGFNKFFNTGNENRLKSNKKKVVPGGPVQQEKVDNGHGITFRGLTGNSSKGKRLSIIHDANEDVIPIPLDEGQLKHSFNRDRDNKENALENSVSFEKAIDAVKCLTSKPTSQLRPLTSNVAPALEQEFKKTQLKRYMGNMGNLMPVKPIRKNLICAVGQMDVVQAVDTEDVNYFKTENPPDQSCTIPKPKPRYSLRYREMYYDTDNPTPTPKPRTLLPQQNPAEEQRDRQNDYISKEEMETWSIIPPIPKPRPDKGTENSKESENEPVDNSEE